MTAATTTADTTTSSAGTLLPTATTGVAHHDATLAFPTMAPRLLQAPQQYPVYFLPHPVALCTIPAAGSPTYVPTPVLVQPPVELARKRKP
jgi:hypothetical protein